MTYLIGEPCIDRADRACVEDCPVDRGYLGRLGVDTPLVAARPWGVG